MSTDYFVSLAAVSGEKTEIKIIDSINPLPLSDTWEGDEIALGSKGGKVASWGMEAAVLHTGPGIGGNVTLDSFSKNTKQGDSGTGSKINDMGSFPDGDLTWHCHRIE